MKKTNLRSLGLLVLSASIVVLASCQSKEDLLLETDNPIAKNDAPDEITSQTATLESVIPPSPVATLPNGVLPAASPYPYGGNAIDYSATPISNPMAFARSIFDDDINVAPWLANYVGSYGLLPTRVQDKGPFLYSFDISPNADVFHDDDFYPLDDDLIVSNDDDE